MANYANLISTINAQIKQNGTGAITGPVLNGVLRDMVSELGEAGYLYKGIATPATSPGTPDSNVFYIASTAGTYTNFGGKVVADGEVAILKYNGTWTKEVTGAATAAQVTQLGQDVERFPVSDSGLHNSIVKELYIEDPNYVATDVYTFAYIDRKFSGNNAWRFQIKKNGNNFFLFSSTAYEESSFFDYTTGGIRVRAIINWGAMTIGQRISTSATINNTCLDLMFSPTIANMFVRTSGENIIDYNSANSIWQRLLNIYAGENTAENSAWINNTTNCKPSLVKNTRFPYYGNALNLLFSGGSGNCIVRINLPAGTKSTAKKFKFYADVYCSTTTGTSGYYYLGADASSVAFTSFLISGGICGITGQFNASQLGSDAFWLRLFGANGTTIQVGRFQLVDITDGDIPLPYMQVKEPLSDLSIGARFSPFAGAKLVALGDSITYQNTWQQELSRLIGTWYDGYDMRVSELGVGGSSICPAIILTTSVTSTPAVDDQNNPIRDAGGNALYFVTGHGVGQSLYSRAGGLAGKNPGLIALWGGQNDTKNVTYSNVGTASDTPYEGKQYVSAQFAAVAKYYGGVSHDIAIIDDGTAVLDPEYTGGDYTILSSAPTFCACVAGLLKKVVTLYPAIRVFGISLMRSRNGDTENRIAQNEALMATYAHYATTCINLWDNLGANAFNYSTLFADDVHPNSAGGLRIASIIAEQI